VLRPASRRHGRPDAAWYGPGITVYRRELRSKLVGAGVRIETVRGLGDRIVAS
jgi:hypothetical protein